MQKNKNLIIMKDLIGLSIQFPIARKVSLKQNTHNFGIQNPFTLNTAFQYMQCLVLNIYLSLIAMVDFNSTTYQRLML